MNQMLTKTSTWRDRIKEAMHARKINARQLSRDAGLGDSFVSGMLTEGKDPSAMNLVKICDCLGVTVNWVLYGAEAEPEAERLLRAFSHMTPEQQDIFLRLAEIALPPSTR